MPAPIPLVDYLVLDDEPYLAAHQCVGCGARYFDRRNACANCEAADFERVAIATSGTLTAFTIVSMAAPGIPVPFVAGVIDCDGTTVKANVLNVHPDPEHVHTGMKLKLTTHSLGTDDEGTEAIGFGFEPI